MHKLLLITALLAVICGYSCRKEQTADALENTNWRLVRIVEGDRTQDIPADVAITATFQAGRLTGNGGCNDYQATYAATDDQLSITLFSTTYAGCPQLERAEERYYKALKASQTWEIDRKNLTVRNADGLLFFKKQ